MSRSPGTRIGAFEILGTLGAGGMGEVYRAHDTRLDRDVAIKILPESFAADADRLMRFEREARTLASLNHPHIAAIYGLEDRALVMELVEGEDLSQRLTRGPIPLDEAIPIARQVAEALEAAHEQGIIHRDLKPANVKVRPDGAVKVLDFGLAKALETGAGSREIGDVSNSPTITSPAMTRAGMILGTAAYMSPEQAKGRPVDKRADIWAFGVVLYEMLSGRALFAADTVSEVLAAVLRADIDLARLPATTPAAVRRLVARCLDRDPKTRLRDIGEARVLLLDAAAAAPDATVVAPRAGSRTLSRAAIGAAIVGLVMGAAAASAFWALFGARQGEGDAQRVEFAYRPELSSSNPAQVAISRDGRRIVQSLKDSSGLAHLVIRELGSTALAVVPGSEGAAEPNFSPDGESIAFFSDGKVKRIPAAGGPATVVVAAASANTAPSWGDDGSIVYTKSNDGLWRVPEGGGEPTRLTSLDAARKELNHWYPQVLPGGRAALFNSFSTPMARSRIEAVEYGTLRRTVLVEGAIFARYVRSGHLLYVRDAAIFAVPFDLARLSVTGPEVPVVEDVAWTVTDGVAGFAVSDTGTLVYLKGSEWSTVRRVVWADRAGTQQPLLPDAALWAEPRLSPDGRWLAVTRQDPNWQIWLYDLNRRVLTQLTHSSGVSFDANWLPDSRSVIHSVETPVYDLVRAPIDGSAPVSVLATPFDKMASSVSPDAQTIAFHETRDRDYLMLAHVASGDPKAVDPRPGSQRNAVFSPDGRWLAYAEVGEDQKPQVYVRALDRASGRHQVSADGGDQPRWTRGGREIVYRTGVAFYSASFAPATGEVGTPALLFRQSDAGRLGGGRSIGYDVTPDGARFVLVVPLERPDAQPVVVVLNWLDELKRKVKR